MLQFSSPHEIEAKFQGFFPNDKKPSSQFSTKRLKAGNRDFICITAFPYRGSALFWIYCYEQTEVGKWELRSMIPVFGKPFDVEYETEGETIKITNARVVIGRITHLYDVP